MSMINVYDPRNNTGSIVIVLQCDSDKRRRRWLMAGVGKRAAEAGVTWLLQGKERSLTG